jgi:fermentation-respiration switch protein FrsA (DUF1100 family)
MPTERFTFTGHGGHALAARLDLPDGPQLATALFAHCFTCSKDIPRRGASPPGWRPWGSPCCGSISPGWAIPEGEFENTTFTSNIDDLTRAAEALAERDMAPDLLIGHSLGGAAVLRAAAGIPSARAVVTIGAPFDPGHVTNNFGAALDRIADEGVAEVDLGGRPSDRARLYRGCLLGRAEARHRQPQEGASGDARPARHGGGDRKRHRHLSPRGTPRASSRSTMPIT